MNNSDDTSNSHLWEVLGTKEESLFVVAAAFSQAKPESEKIGHSTNLFITIFT